MSAAPVPNWRPLAEAASKEHDHEKLLQVVRELCDALDKDHAKQDEDLVPRKPLDTSLDLFELCF
jgi:hypothetical protein